MFAPSAPVSRFVATAAAAGWKYAPLDRLMAEFNLLRSIMRLTGMARNTIAKRVKKSPVAGPAAVPAAAEKGAIKAVGSART